jgi:hypothetical protein
VQGWVLTSLAEMAVHAGMMTEAEAQFGAALSLGAADYYLLGAFADFLLDNSRPEEVLDLLRDRTAADPLLLRYALALQAQHSKELPASWNYCAIASRPAVCAATGCTCGRRPGHLASAQRTGAGAATRTGKLAGTEEPADVRILLEAALAACDGAAVDAVREWLSNSRLERSERASGTNAQIEGAS